MWVTSANLHQDFLGNVFVNDERVYKESLGQFTGFYDEDDQGVFEGDIVTARLSTMDIDVVIAWNEKDAKFQADYLSGGKFSDLSQAKLEHWHVVGNIFDRK